MYPMNVTKLSHQDGAKKIFFLFSFKTESFNFHYANFP